ncbi:kinesin-domain-containing protein [Backusella circina FSU 941]|nr:kinesin-domain-containing protein [Backusella circina FSU 941]
MTPRPTRPNSENVKVTVRCRPIKPGQAKCWEVDSEQQKVMAIDGRLRNQEYQFDNVFYGSDNEALFTKSVKGLINQAMEGYNATVFAYGQTASGKTFTMGNETEPGVIPRSVDNVFEYIRKAITREFLLRVSYLEIYNETIRDLLNPSNQNLKITEEKQRGVYVTSLTEEVVTCKKDVIKVIERGEANRHISSTDYNLHSSRSHTIFQMVIESRERTSTSIINRRTMTSTGYGNTGRTKELVKVSQLNLIDLAGSEKAVSDENRRKEGSYINKSLLTLGTVISKLTENSKSQGHIPYRDSKLTRILQTSLSGRAKVAVICTISPSLATAEESVNTLKFASRVKRIVVHAKNDLVVDDKALLQKYRGEIMDLRSKLELTSDRLRKEKEQSQSVLTAERLEHEQQLRQMGSVRSALKDRIDQLTRLILTSSSVSSPPVSEQRRESVESVSPETVPLRQQMESDKDKRIQLLEAQVKEQSDLISKLQTELSVTKAELYVTKQMNEDHSILYPTHKQSTTVNP